MAAYPLWVAMSNRTRDKKLLPDGVTLLDHSRFVYGGAVHGSVEVFLTDGVLFLVKAQGRFLFGTDVHVSVRLFLQD